MSNLTREQAITEHRKMWNWIAEQIEHSKCVNDINLLKIHYLFNYNTYSVYIENHCFLCEYTLNDGTSCKK